MDRLSPTSDRPAVSRRLIAVAAVLACAGCSGEQFRVAEVTGTITRAGRPAAGVFVQFSPPGGHQAGLPSAYGMTDAQGRYRLVRPGSKTGAVVGLNTVTVSTIDPDPGQASAESTSVFNHGSFDIHVQPGTNTIDFPIGESPAANASASR